MNVWIIRLFPYEGGMVLEAFFRTEGSARETWQQICQQPEVGGKMTIRDDHGLEFSVDPSRCAALLTNAYSSASFTAALAHANAEAARIYGLDRAPTTRPPDPIPGSTLQ